MPPGEARQRVRSLAGWTVAAALVGVALHHSRPAPLRPDMHPLSDTDARAFYFAAAEAEVAERKKAVGRFRGSPWSQDDEFHNKEAKFLRTYAREHRQTLAALVDALDRGMHEHWPTPPNAVPDQKVLPCRPRLNY